jgi:ferrochelatase
VPVAFVSDHVETLGEIDHEAREEARRLGIQQFEMSAGLNDSPKFISALGELVLEALGEKVYGDVSSGDILKDATTSSLVATG